MREAVGIPAGLLSYALATIILLILFDFVLPNPRQWSYLITIATTLIAFQVTCAAVMNFSTETGVKIVALMIAIFWVVSLGVDVFYYAEKVIDVLSAGQGGATGSLANLKELAEAVWNTKICAVITVILTVRTLAK